MAAIGTVNTIGQNQSAESSMCPAETEANSNQTSGPTYMYQDAIQSKKMAPTETPGIRHGTPYIIRMNSNTRHQTTGMDSPHIKHMFISNSPVQ
jgi:hypothetical protein